MSGILETPQGEETMTVTMRVSRSTFERAAQIAAREQRQLEELWGVVVDEGLTNHESAKEILERVSQSYCARLEREGKLNQTSQEIMQELRELRERLADEDYPDEIFNK